MRCAGLTSALVVLVAMVSVGQCQFDRRGLCNYIVQSCGNQFMNIIQSMEHSPDIGRACGMAADVRSCMGNCLTLLIQNNPQQRAMVRVLEYVCDPSRREQIQQISEAQCFTDGTLEANFEREAEQCAQTKMANMETVVMQAVMSGNRDVNSIMCPIVQEVIDCINGKVEDMCGADVVPLVNDIFHIVLREMLVAQMPNCFDQVQVSHSVLKRAVEYVKMLRK